MPIGLFPQIIGIVALLFGFITIHSCFFDNDSNLYYSLNIPKKKKNSM